MATELMCARLRDAAVDCQNELVRYNLNLVAAELDDAVSAFVLSPSDDNLRRITGHWAHGQLMIHNAGLTRTPCATNASLTTS